jgi:hypothetical protein
MRPVLERVRSRFRIVKEQTASRLGAGVASELQTSMNEFRISGRSEARAERLIAQGARAAPSWDDTGCYLFRE